MGEGERRRGGSVEGGEINLFVDKGVLEEEEDILMNINMLEAEKAVNNVELKKGKPGYNPYDREEVDEEGNVSGVGGRGVRGGKCEWCGREGNVDEREEEGREM